MEYIHPKQYKGVRFGNMEQQQNIIRAKVEKYCLKCDLFMGKEHDFSECNFFDKHKKGELIAKKTCPFPDTAVSLFTPEVNCKIEDK